MFVQSHIQRHNHHHHHHHHPHHHQHSHNHQHQRHSGHGPHHHSSQQPQRSHTPHHTDSTSIGHRIRAASSSTNNSNLGGLAAIQSLTKSTTASAAGFAYVLGPAKLDQVSSDSSKPNREHKPRQTFELCDNSNNKQNHHRHLHSENSGNIRTAADETTDGIESGGIYKKSHDQAAKTNFVTNSPPADHDERRSENNLNTSADLLNNQKRSSGPGQVSGEHRRHSYRNRTRSLGSHESLKVYDFMSRPTRVATGVQQASTTATSLETGRGGIQSARLRLARVDPPEGSGPQFHRAQRCVHRRRREDQAAGLSRRAFSDVGSSTGEIRSVSLGKILAGSHQLLNVLLGTPWLLAGRLTAKLSRPESNSDEEPRSTRLLLIQNRSPSVEVVRSFCMSFITYQLETWRLLANDLARDRPLPTTTVNQALPIIPAKFTRQQDHSITSLLADESSWRGTGHAKVDVAPAAAVGFAQHSEHHPLRGRKFLSLDRPALERQREIVFDDSAEPVIEVPHIFREPPPQARLQSAIAGARHHHHSHHLHRHNHRQHDGNQLSTIGQISRPVVQPNSVSDHLMASFYQQQHVASQPLTFDESADYKYRRQDGGNFLCSNQSQPMANGAGLHRKAQFYLGQHSLDCDHLHREPFLSVSRQFQQQALLEERCSNLLSTNCDLSSRDDDTWSDRPLSDEDSRSTFNCHQEKSAHQADGKSTKVNCDDHYDDSKKQSTNTNLNLHEDIRARKRRSMKKSISPLSFEGARRRLGLKRKEETAQLSSISVNRSEEVIPTEVRHLSRQTTFNSLYDSGTESGSFWHCQAKSSVDPRANFVEGIGVGQIASRQALVSPYLGDIQLSVSSRRGMLEVEVIRARRLHPKPGAKTLPSPYVKVYLMKEKKCLAKCRTHQANQTLDPLYQEPFVFRNEFKNCVLQVIVWGDYGKRDRKSMMGIVQIHLDDLDISNMVIGWYKLFNVPSMTSFSASSKVLRQRLLHSSSISESPINS